MLCKKIWLNKTQIIEDYRICGPGVINTSKLPLTLNKGWNHFLVKVGTQDGYWTFSAKLECSDPELMKKIKASSLPGKANKLRC